MAEYIITFKDEIVDEKEAVSMVIEGSKEDTAYKSGYIVMAIIDLFNSGELDKMAYEKYKELTNDPEQPD